MTLADFEKYIYVIYFESRTPSRTPESAWMPVFQTTRTRGIRTRGNTNPGDKNPGDKNPGEHEPGGSRTRGNTSWEPISSTWEPISRCTSLTDHTAHAQLHVILKNIYMLYILKIYIRIRPNQTDPHSEKPCPLRHDLG